MRLGICLLGAAIATTAGGGQGKQHIIRLDYNGSVCSADFDGLSLPAKDGYPDLTGIRSDDRPVHIVGSSAIPYKCIGGVIYGLQIDGFKAIDFDAAPHGQNGAPAKAGAQSHR